MLALVNPHVSFLSYVHIPGHGCVSIYEGYIYFCHFYSCVNQSILYKVFYFYQVLCSFFILILLLLMLLGQLRWSSPVGGAMCLLTKWRAVLTCINCMLCIPGQVVSCALES